MEATSIAMGSEICREEAALPYSVILTLNKNKRKMTRIPFVSLRADVEGALL